MGTESFTPPQEMVQWIDVDDALHWLYGKMVPAELIMFYIRATPPSTPRNQLAAGLQLITR